MNTTRSTCRSASEAVRFMKRLSALSLSSLCSPGVSTYTTWRSSSVLIPRIWCRVVCGLREVMLSFCPRIRFSSVDLPTLGRPTIATYPQRCVVSLIPLPPDPVVPVRHGPLPVRPDAGCCHDPRSEHPAMLLHSEYGMSDRGALPRPTPAHTAAVENGATAGTPADASWHP